MNQQIQRLAVSGLRWTLGVVLLLQSIRFVFSPASLHKLGKSGHSPWLRAGLGGAEIIGALLFLVPAASLAGGILLIFVFLFAAGVHLLHGEFDVGSLVIYAMAVTVCITHQRRK